MLNYTVLDFIVDGSCLFTVILLRQLTLGGLRTRSVLYSDSKPRFKVVHTSMMYRGYIFVALLAAFSVLTIIYIYQITGAMLFSYPNCVLQFQLSRMNDYHIS